MGSANNIAKTVSPPIFQAGHHFLKSHAAAVALAIATAGFKK
jgi:hypothetical protein